MCFRNFCDIWWLFQAFDDIFSSFRRCMIFWCNMMSVGWIDCEAVGQDEEFWETMNPQRTTNGPEWGSCVSDEGLFCWCQLPAAHRQMRHQKSSTLLSQFSLWIVAFLLIQCIHSFLHIRVLCNLFICRMSYNSKEVIFLPPFKKS